MSNDIYKRALEEIADAANNGTPFDFRLGDIAHDALKAAERAQAEGMRTGYPPRVTFTLEAMARNYSTRHSWDHLDKEACLLAAKHLRELSATPPAKASEPLTDDSRDAARWRALVKVGHCGSKEQAGFVVGSPKRAEVQFRYWSTVQQLEALVDAEVAAQAAKGKT